MTHSFLTFDDPDHISLDHCKSLMSPALISNVFASPVVFNTEAQPFRIDSLPTTLGGTLEVPDFNATISVTIDEFPAVSGNPHAPQQIVNIIHGPDGNNGA